MFKSALVFAAMLGSLCASALAEDAPRYIAINNTALRIVTPTDNSVYGPTTPPLIVQVAGTTTDIVNNTVSTLFRVFVVGAGDSIFQNSGISSTSEVSEGLQNTPGEQPWYDLQTHFAPPVIKKGVRVDVSVFPANLPFRVVVYAVPDMENDSYDRATAVAFSGKFVIEGSGAGQAAVAGQAASLNAGQAAILNTGVGTAPITA